MAAKIYSHKRFNYPVAMRVPLSAKMTVTNAVGATNNPDFDTVNGLGRKDIGSVIEVDVAAKTGTVLAAKPDAIGEGKEYYLLAEVPVAADDKDFYFVGIVLPDMGAINNLIEDHYRGNWADQFHNLRTSGVK